MKIFKIGNEVDLKKVEAKNIEPINITKTDTGWDVEVEEDVDVDSIIKTGEVVSSPEEEEEKEEDKIPEKKKKKKKK